MSMNGANALPRCSDREARPLAVVLMVLFIVSFLLALVLALASCAQPQKTQVPTYEQAKAQALKEGPLVEPPVEQREKLKCEDKPVAVKKGPGVPFNGVLFTNDRTACLRAITAERDKMRTTAEAKELQMRIRRIVADAATKRLAEEVKRSWWERNQGAVLFSLGATIGAGVVIGLVYAITGGKAVGTQVHVLPPLQGGRR